MRTLQTVNICSGWIIFFKLEALLLERHGSTVLLVALLSTGFALDIDRFGGSAFQVPASAVAKMREQRIYTGLVLKTA